MSTKYTSQKALDSAIGKLGEVIRDLVTEHGPILETQFVRVPWSHQEFSLVRLGAIVSLRAKAGLVVGRRADGSEIRTEANASRHFTILNSAIERAGLSKCKLVGGTNECIYDPASGPPANADFTEARQALLEQASDCPF